MKKKRFGNSTSVWEQEEAVKVFTDREDPQEAFERKYRALCKFFDGSEERSNRNLPFVLCYYGIGGIGKTSFVNKLCRVIRRVPENDCRLLDRIDCHYIRYDFDADGAVFDKFQLLLNWRRQLTKENPQFKFFRFDAAVVLYWQKNGEDLNKITDAKSLLEGQPLINALLNFAPNLLANHPAAAVAASAIQSLDTLDIIGKLGDLFKPEEYKKHLEKINMLEPPELLGELHKYFSHDMWDNMNCAEKPLVIFLDSYEKFVPTGDCEDVMMTQDHWLRKGPFSVIRSIPGILWVITGREKLRWAEDEDDKWDEFTTQHPLSQMTDEEKETLARVSLEQHLLGDLSLQDATFFLQTAGITSNELCEQLYRLTNGTPLFLDICVETYDELRRNGESLTIENFGKDLDQLISRYLASMDPINREMIYFLACLGTWTDENVHQIAPMLKTLRNYTASRYRDFKKHSFVIPGSNGSFYLHETVRIAAYKNADEEIVEEVNRTKLALLRKDVENGDEQESNAKLHAYVKPLSEVSLQYKELLEHLRVIREQFVKMEKRFMYDDLHLLSLELCNTIHKRYPNTGAELIARSEYANSLRMLFAEETSLELLVDIRNLESTVDLEEQDWCRIKSIAAKVFQSNWRYEEAAAFAKESIKSYIQLFGEYHPNTLAVMSDLAYCFMNPEDVGSTLYILKSILEKCIACFGKGSLETVNAMYHLACVYYAAGDIENFITFAEWSYKVYSRILGNGHSRTLNVMYMLADSYAQTRQYSKALEFYERQFEVLELRDFQKNGYNLESFDFDQIETVMESLCVLYSRMGKADKARAMRGKLEKWRRDRTASAGE